jgi:hypothetical protein
MDSSRRARGFAFATCALLAVVALSPLPATIQVGFPVLSRSGNTTGYANFTGALTGTSSPCLDGSGNLTISGCPPPGPTCIKTTIPFTALTAAATTMDITLGSAIAANSILDPVRIKEQTQFACTGGCANITTMTVSVGISGTGTAYTPIFSIMQTPSNTNFFLYGPTAYTSASNTPVAHFAVTNNMPGNLGNGVTTNLTAGSVDVHYCYVTLP